MKTKRHILLIVIGMFLINHIQAYDFSAVHQGQTIYYKITSSIAPYTVEVVSQNDEYPYYTNYPQGVLTVPDTVFHDNITYTVEGIGLVAFGECDKLTAVYLPATLKYIALSAFGRCSSLCSITIPENVEAIGLFSFQECTSLLSIDVAEQNRFYKSVDGILYDYSMDTLCVLPPGKGGVVCIPNQVKIIRTGAFYKCNNLSSVLFGDSITIIEDEAFSDCLGLRGKLVLPNSLKYIGAAAFYACYGLDTVIIPDAVIRIYSYAFASCRNVRSVVIGHSVKDIDMSSFGSCHNLESLIIGESVEIIDDFAFMNCIKLQGHLNIPEKIRFIGNWAFYNCVNISSVSIGDSIRRIGRSAFPSGLEKITIGSSIEYIGKFALNANELQEIIIKSTSPPFIDNYTFISSTKQNAVVYVPCNSKSLYEADTLWNKFAHIEEALFDFTVNVQSNNSAWGRVKATPVDCEENNATLTALPDTNYRFLKWNDGNTDNPRYIKVYTDTSFTAIFAYANAISEMSEDGLLRIYPNPVTTQLSMDYGNYTIKEVIIYDVTGKEVMHKVVNHNQASIDVSALHGGFYFLRCKMQDGKSIIQKIIKK
ncbi:MAG: leucine-rich repeat protein [Bacteroidales bacterium]|nr:leucine-rich repeat protein [Bacteroidales bacterium]